VEWAHAIAPQAKILLIVAKSASLTNLLAAVDSAVAKGASQVSMVAEA
jgi:subtilase family serine protease